MNRKLILACGLSATGKSYWCSIIMALLQKEKPVFFDIDEVREKTWGERARSLTSEEHRFKNELTRAEVKKAFILGAQTVVLNMVMPTKEHHQKPFMGMIRDTERILSKIEFQRENEKIPSAISAEPAELSARINVGAIWFTCDDLEVVRKRLERRSREADSSPSDLRSLDRYIADQKNFQPPDGENYPFIKIDTSEESVEADKSRILQIMDFICD